VKYEVTAVQVSNLFPLVAPDAAGKERAASLTLESFPARTAEVGALTVRRILPVRERRMVGPWCFFDRFGPMSFVFGKPMDVAPHPHIGLQTVSWLLSGEIMHNDSAGGQGLLHPGELNLMTAGAGIAHAEETPPAQSGKLDGVQLWVALPDAHRHSEPSFTHYSDIPVAELPGGRLVVIMGEAANVRSPAKTLSPIVALEVVVDKGAELELPLDPAFEHAFVILEGDSAFEKRSLPRDTLHYLGIARDRLSFFSREGARLLLLGGPPFGETVLMWWNFVARTTQEIEDAREDWLQHRRFGDATAYRGPRLEAPPLHVNLAKGRRP
jgi:redox-sensitive bicupin YhaK (pirin superfamily)